MTKSMTTLPAREELMQLRRQPRLLSSWNTIAMMVRQSASLRSGQRCITSLTRSFVKPAFKREMRKIREMISMNGGEAGMGLTRTGTTE